MGVTSRIVLQLKSTGFNNGEVFITSGGRDVLVYHGPAAKAIYDSLKRFVEERREGSFDFYEQKTTSGVQWRERT